ncbi:hypothetical protein LR48_Vigan05g153800 [Vigna angularis]|uniref:Uncharacterized protein n=1 Tax=Phaseolus angularis TaxID=3914 RepID=A0A0L9UMF5_PHAAN|nr:hypothetical protein LR48_Vigan05g153800 [Vigna angularis]
MKNNDLLEAYSVPRPPVFGSRSDCGCKWREAATRLVVEKSGDSRSAAVDDLAGARVKMVKIGGRDIARDRVGWWCENEGEMQR